MAKTRMDVEIGWEGVVRFGGWTPVFVTLADPAAPDAIVEIYGESSGMYGMRARQYVGTLAPQARTFPLYVPISSYFGSFSPSPVHVLVRDARTRKVLARTDPGASAGARYENVQPNQYLLGVSGRRTGLQQLRTYVTGATTSVGYLPLGRLPLTPIGYDGLDALVLNAADLTGLSEEQQQAIADWVRAGGSLLCWPGNDPVPASGPLLEILPATIGTLRSIDLSERLSDLGLARRFAQLPAWNLGPRPEAQSLRLLGDDRLLAYHAPVGVGHVVISPVNLADLQFNAPPPALQTWEPLLDLLMDRTSRRNNQSGYWSSPRVQAEQQIADVLGNVPGAGQFGFSYVAIVMLGLMVIVGPVDWLVLKLLKKQPWTWVTTAGWIGLVTVGAIYAGHLLKSGELHFRTFALVEQAGGGTVARSEYVGIYAPKTAEYNIKTDPATWWEPLSPGIYYTRPGADMVFHQTWRGNTPEPMVINVWSLRFLNAEQIAGGQPMVEASLQLARAESGQKPRVVGTIRNLTDRPLRDVRVRTTAGLARAAEVEIPAAGSVDVDWPIEPVVSTRSKQHQETVVYGPYGPQYQEGPGVDIWQTAEGLADDRTQRLYRLLGVKRPDVNTNVVSGAVIFDEAQPVTPVPAAESSQNPPVQPYALIMAEQLDPDAHSKLEQMQAVEQHRLLLRGLVPLKVE